MYIQKFEDVVAWQKAREMTRNIYKSLTDCRDFGFKDQIVFTFDFMTLWTFDSIAPSHVIQH